MQRIIGGMFGLLESEPRPASGKIPAFLGLPHLMLSSARSAFRLLDAAMSPKNIWLPAYLCDVVVDAILPSHDRIRWYPVDLGLRIVDESWIEGIEEGDFVVFITYFGFNGWTELGHRARRRGGVVIEDAAQALLGDLSAVAHYSVLSPRKFLGVPDGGVLVAHGSSRLPDAPSHFAPQWWLKALRASQERQKYDEQGGERGWFRLFNEFESECSTEPGRMSELSQLLLERCADYASISERRRDNYRLLLASLREFAIFRDLPGNVVPLGFPVRVSHRDALRQRLFDSDIFPPLHWPVGRVVPRRFSDSHTLESMIMTLPCDQRYDATDMQRMVDCFIASARELSAQALGDSSSLNG